MKKNKYSIIPFDLIGEMLNVRTSFYRDMFRKKYRNCVLILYQNLRILTDEQFVNLFEELVEHTPCIDFVHLWDNNSQYKYYSLLDHYLFLNNKYVLEPYKNNQSH